LQFIQLIVELLPILVLAVEIFRIWKYRMGISEIRCVRYTLLAITFRHT